MTQQELNREVARVTGEAVGTIAGRGFVPLTHGPVERERDSREPLWVDWDEVEANREVLYPV